MKLRLIAALAGMAAIALTCAACVQQQGTLGGEDTPPPSPPGQSDELPQEHVHEPVFVAGIEPDCTAPGILAHWECGCGKYFADETCQTPLGEDELILSPDGHEYEPVTTEPTCTEQGYTKYVCSACGDSYIDGSSYTPPAEHDLFVEQVITEPGCTHGGERKLACRNCEYVEIEPLPATGHYYKETVVPPKCDADGYTLHICERCGDEYKDNFTQKLPHSYEVTEEVSPDCEHAGHRKFVCEACGDGYTVTLPETGHMWQVAEEGYTQEGAPYTVYVCSACGADRREEGDPPSATEGLIFAAAGDHCAVVGMLSNDKAIELVIPSVHDGLPVTEIAESAFEDNLQIISASLPHGLQKIGRRAFAGCANLAEVNIPDTTTAISGSAFRDCRSLISVYYDAKSADDCQSLDIFRNAGRDRGGLTLYVGKGVERIPALLFSASGADTAPNLTDIVFEEGCALSEIGEAAFTGCAYLKEIAMPASLEIIGAEAFLDCSELEYVSCPEGVQIGAAAFGNTADDFVLEYYAA